MAETQSNTQPATNDKPVAKPNELGSISVQGYVKIFDPNSQQVILEKRA